jgi:transposase
MVDLTRESKGRVRARLLGLVLGRSGTAYADRLDAQDETFRAGLKHAALDPFRGYAHALLDSLLCAWKTQILPYFDTGGVSNRSTEAINMLTEMARRLAHGYANLENYRLRMLLAAGGQRSRDEGPHHVEIRRAKAGCGGGARA